ncbi:hypothetical protein [Streptomyces sp. NBC_00690]|uniref:hypothetical protein n=1 Tax=Streptomyces sp. NBC_00690 TaxID=2975808 RepID=UPI002E2DBF6C|nr:hypothetical protein [Streptomyces sp. NBC_00690]
MVTRAGPASLAATPSTRLVQWEVEALEPAELRCLVLAAVTPYIDIRQDSGAWWI